ncbi:hypothetical protein [Hylemonella gracilis]|uniref:hypothetical protein n=1 Tax=Hylemonella gracilis TaxID=80880 RepID=UPI00103BEBA2|nr:hypothetical protein [Hylemonella gracilis]
MGDGVTRRGAEQYKEKQISFPNRWLGQRFFFRNARPRPDQESAPPTRESKSRARGKPLSRQLPRLLPSFSLSSSLKFFHNPLHEVKRMAFGFL